MKRKMLMFLLTLVCVICCAIGFTACGGDTGDSGNGGTANNGGNTEQGGNQGGNTQKPDDSQGGNEQKPEHTTHTYDQKNTDAKYLKSKANCQHKAVYYFSCTCGKQGDETFEYGELGKHEYKTYVSDDNATCVKNGTETAKCEYCAEKDTKEIANSKLSHTFDIQVIEQKYLKTEATCQRKAEYYFSCVCGEKGTETFEYGEIDANNHDTEHHNGQAATCTADGWNEYDTCKRVGCNYTTKTTIPQLGHNFSNEFTTDKDPTCTENGSKSKHCSRCEATTEVTVIPANGHSWNDGEVTKDPNCTETGVKTYTCLVCKGTRAEEIAALGHNYATEFTTDREPTCAEDGSKSKHCSRCEETTEVTVIPANGHSWNDGEVTKDPNCTETGVKTYTCLVCKGTRAEEIAAFGHTKGEAQQTVNPTCTEQGYTIYSCEVCGNEFNADYLPAWGHNYNSEWVCTHCGHEYATDGLVYELSQDETYYTIVGYTGNSIQVVIPAHYNEILVTSIGNSAFA